MIIMIKRVNREVMGDAVAGGECYEIALLRDGERSRNIRTCVDRAHSRRRLVYVSTTSSVEVVLLRRSSDFLHGTFILHYNGKLRRLCLLYEQLPPNSKTNFTESCKYKFLRGIYAVVNCIQAKVETFYKSQIL